MMKIILLFLFLPLLLPGQNSTATVLSPRQQLNFLKEMRTQLAHVDNFKVDFEQQRHLSILTEPLISYGKCYFGKPNKLRWELREPYASILISANGKVAKFEIEKGRVKKLNFGAANILGKVLTQIISWMKADFKSTESMYQIQIRQKQHFIIYLKPASAALRSNLKLIELHLENKGYDIQQVIIRESESDYTTILFTNKVENISMPANMFDLKHPGLNE